MKEGCNGRLISSAAAGDDAFHMRPKMVEIRFNDRRPLPQERKVISLDCGPEPYGSSEGRMTGMACVVGA